MVCVQKDYLCNGIILTMSANKVLGLDYVCNVVQSDDTRLENLAHFVWRVIILHVATRHLSFNICVLTKRNKVCVFLFYSGSLCRIAKNLGYGSVSALIRGWL